MRCTKVVFRFADGTLQEAKYFSASSVRCPVCIQEVPQIVDGKPAWWRKQKPKLGIKCPKCQAEVVEAVFDEAQKTRQRILFSGTDSRGNSYRVSECFGQQDSARNGKDCELPCVMVGGTNHQTKSSRSHTIHVPFKDLQSVIDVLQAFQQEKKPSE